MATEGSMIKLGDAEEIYVPEDIDERRTLRTRVEPWLSAVIGSEHLSLLVGNGLSTAVVRAAGGTPATMGSEPLDGAHFKAEVEQAAKKTAVDTGREEPNLEDRIRAALTLIGGLKVMGQTQQAEAWSTVLDHAMQELVGDILKAERALRDAPLREEDGGPAGAFASWREARHLLGSFLLAFASRPASRDRLHVFSTNYDRLIEYGCDLAGLRPLDRFVGGMAPVFRAGRLDIDMHYNPPGIRGEPRYLDGVLRLTKLHGSLDWRWQDGKLSRVGLPFGAEPDNPALPASLSDGLMIYPSPAKDVETGMYPYAELFRDLSAASCRPNSALVTYGYGFGDEHINRVLADMLAIPSTHLVIISWDRCNGRLDRFLKDLGHPASVSQIVGRNVADLGFLVDHLLPHPGHDVLLEREASILNRRGHPPERDAGPTATPNAPAEVAAEAAPLKDER